jgi:hypothetical protein
MIAPTRRVSPRCGCARDGSAHAATPPPRSVMTLLLEKVIVILIFSLEGALLN